MIPWIIDGVGHPGDAARGADVGGHALEGHHGHRAGVLRDLGVIGRDDVHDDAALEHLGEALLGRPGGRLWAHVWIVPQVRARARGRSPAPGSCPFGRSGRTHPADYRTRIWTSRVAQ